MVCDYFEICKELNFELDQYVECEPVTVMRWLCQRDNRVMMLCDNHALCFDCFCPYHRDVKLLYSMLDGPVNSTVIYTVVPTAFDPNTES